MPNVYDSIDLSFGWNGDYSIGSDGDLEDTSNNGLLSLIDQLHDLAASTFKDWELYPSRGAGLDDFVGEPNTRSTGNRIHDRWRTAIVSAGLVVEDDLEIRVAPVHKHKVLIVTSIDAVATETNTLLQGQKLTIAMVFDTIERETFFLEKTPNLTQD